VHDDGPSDHLTALLVFLIAVVLTVILVVLVDWVPHH
jgi:hypothetical protein